eukprot:scaffold3150_cov51-Attheya_sp.AAC.12
MSDFSRNRFGLMRRASVLLVLGILQIAFQSHRVVAFTARRSLSVGRPSSWVARRHYNMVAEPVTMGPPIQLDSNGKEYIVGCVVRVALPLKAFQVKRKGRGSFDPETKAFVPRPEDVTERKELCLELPPGLRGVVQRVYDTEELGPNFPVYVKFTPGENVDSDGYDTPVPFLMHFDNHELEVVE